MAEINKHTKQKFKWKTRDSLVLGVSIFFVICWFIGKQQFHAFIDPFYEKAWPEAEYYEFVSENHANVSLVEEYGLDANPDIETINDLIDELGADMPDNVEQLLAEGTKSKSMTGTPRIPREETLAAAAGMTAVTRPMSSCRLHLHVHSHCQDQARNRCSHPQRSGSCSDAWPSFCIKMARSCLPTSWGTKIHGQEKLDRYA